MIGRRSISRKPSRSYQTSARLFSEKTGRESLPWPFSRADAPSAPCGIDGHAAEVEAAGEFQLVGSEDIGLGRGFRALRAAFAGDYLIDST